MNNGNISPIFVVGTPRSGTTLTAKILGGHPDVFMPGETHFFDDVYSRRSELGDPSGEGAASRIASRLMSLYGRYNEPEDQVRVETITNVDAFAADILKKCADYEQVLTWFMDMQMIALQCKVWGNNAPRDIFNVNDIAEFYPNARIIVCVRDPRDFLGSYKGKWRATSQCEVNRLKKLYHPVVTSMLWKSSMKQFPTLENIFTQDQIYVLQYERLVSTPEECARELSRHVGVEYDARMLLLEFSNSSGAQSETAAIFPTSIGSWRDRISADEAWIAQSVCMAEMRYLGYSPERLGVNYFNVLFLYLTTPAALWRALKANAHKRGPLLPYLYKRLASVFARG